jgi:hypothetical protein
MVTFDPKEQLTVELASVSKVNAAVDVAMVEPFAGPLRNIIHGGVVVLVVEEPVVELVEVAVLPVDVAVPEPVELVDVDVPEELVEVAVPLPEFVELAVDDAELLASEDW